MTFPLFAAIGQTIFQLLLSGMAIFLILLVLVQRGRGGGLAGALGGMGGSSAFGAKAGDVFTRVTIVAASLWILLCIIAANMRPSDESRLNVGGIGPAPSASASKEQELSAPSTEDGEATGSESLAGETSATGAAGGETASEGAESGQEVQP